MNHMQGMSASEKPPPVGTHTTLPQQAARPTSTATAAPVRKHLASQKIHQHQPPQQQLPVQQPLIPAPLPQPMPPQNQFKPPANLPPNLDALDTLAVLSEAPTHPMSSTNHIPDIDHVKPLLGVPAMDPTMSMKPDSPPTNGTRNMHHLAMDVLSPETLPDEDSPEKRDDPLDDTNHWQMNNSLGEKRPTSPPSAPNFSQAFTTKQSAASSTVKTAITWSSLIANVGSSTTGPSPPPNSSSSPKATPGAVNNLQQNFPKLKNKHQDQNARKQMQEIHEQQRKYLKKEQQRVETEGRREKEDFDDLEKIRKAIATPTSKPIDDKQNMRKRKHLETPGGSASASPLSNFNNESANKSRDEKTQEAASIQRLKEMAMFERHEAAGRIDLNAQREILEAFEETL
ncbi:Hypothetical predicted protein [Cloeon dipterum]|uniref:Bromodomain protein 4 C-terminal domain-containing protein n=1 Tax=Cloeon dipterum TaxID=197152 RepID=A0A8S1CW52_9INSE|nr:Hypothetical predicted protein [Cloeon dipterum]